MRMQFRIALGFFALALVLLLAACTSEEETDRRVVSGIVTGDSATPEPTGEKRSIFSRQDTRTPQPTGERRSIFSGSFSATPVPASGAPTLAPGGPAPTQAVGTSVQASFCPRRQPDPEVMRPPTSPSPEMDEEALLALFEATGGESWDQSGTWGGLAPIEEWWGVGVGVGGRTPVGQSAAVGPAPTREQITPEVLAAASAEYEKEYGAEIDANTLVAALLTQRLPMPILTQGDDGAYEGRVTALVLNGLTGELPPELGNLTALRTLSITNSRLGGELPPELGNLAALRALSITNSRLGGELPPELGNLSSLETINLSGNRLCGEIPPEMDGLTHLRELNLRGNQLTGRIPNAMARLVNLEELDLESNRLEGEVPSWLSGFSSLAILNLSNNQLAGELPTELDDLALRQITLRVEGNQLEGCQSDLLREYVTRSDVLPVCVPENHAGDTETLVALHQAWGKPDLHNWLSREPIGEWQGVSVGYDGRVAALNLSNRTLNGELPAELGNLTDLRRLELEGSFTGEMPAELGNLTSLKALDIGEEGGESDGFALEGCSPESHWYEGTILERVCEAVTGGFASVNPGESLTCGVRTSGAVACWSRQGGAFAPKELAGEFSFVSVGFWDGCGVKASGAIACWDGEHGVDNPPEGKFASISVGVWHACGVRTNNTVACWGSNSGGRATPPEGRFSSVSSGPFHSCGLRTNGTLACWGDDEQGRAAPPEGEFKSISARGEWHSCGLRTNGAVACWGGNDHGQATPPQGQFVSVSVGFFHTCGLRTNGAVACWGGNDHGQATPPQGQFVSVTAGRSTTCGIRTGGNAVCWGQNSAVPDFAKLRHVNAGVGYVCVSRAADGVRECFGEPPSR